MNAKCKLVLLPAIFLLVGGTSSAQTPNGNQDPFVALHARLLAAAENSLRKIQAGPGPTDFAKAVKSSKPTAANSNDFAGISPSRVSSAQRKLLGLRVDAARIFSEEGVPLELLVVAEVESKFDPLALSPKGARGPWQFMPATAERFGLRVGGLSDERIHPELSTRAAARYLRELYVQFGDWMLALAAYNAGEQRVAHAIEQGGTRDFWQLSQRRLLPEETRRYVPAVLKAENPR